MILMEFPDGRGTIPSTEKPDEPDVAEAKPRYIWIDAAANFPDYANSKENIAKRYGKDKKRQIH